MKKSARKNVRSRKSSAVQPHKALAVILAVALVFSTFQIAAEAVGETCNGINATIVGTSGDDTITGTTGNDVIVALGGNDQIILGSTGSDKDTICAGDGDDVISAANGDAWIDGGSGNDRVTTANGKDTVFGGTGNDSISTGNGNDAINGGDGTDYCNTGSGGQDSASNCETSGSNGIVTIVKDAEPDAEQDFLFTGTLDTFSLDGDPNSAVSNTYTAIKSVGSYSITEVPVGGWAVGSIVCTDPDNGTTTSLGNQTATLDVDTGEVIQCTFLNTQLGGSSSDSASSDQSSSEENNSSSEDGASSESNESSSESSAEESSAQSSDEGSSSVDDSSASSSEESAESSDQSSAESAASSDEASSETSEATEQSSSQENSSAGASSENTQSSDISSESTSSTSSEAASDSSANNESISSASTTTSEGNDDQSQNGLEDSPLVGGNGDYRGHRTNHWKGLLNFLADFHLPNLTIAPGGFGGGNAPLTNDQLAYVCSLQRALSHQNIFSGLLANLSLTANPNLNLTSQQLSKLLKDTKLCEKVNAAFLPARTIVAQQTETLFPLSLDGSPLSKNTTWNACIRGRATLQDIRSNTDRDEDGVPRSCASYHTGNSWYHPDLHVYFTFDSKTKKVTLPEGYAFAPSTVVAGK